MNSPRGLSDGLSWFGVSLLMFAFPCAAQPSGQHEPLHRGGDQDTLPNPAFGESRGSTQRVADPLTGKGAGDGLYGRFKGDVSFRGSLGLEWDAQVEVGRPLLAAELLAYQTVGLYGSYRRGIGADPVSHVLSLGATLSPLFLLRWSKAKETGHAYSDLIIDSLGVAVGAHLSTPRSGHFAEDTGLELGLLGAVPLLPRADGPWIRLRANLLTGRSSSLNEAKPGVTMWATLTWESFFFAGILAKKQ